MSNTTVGLLYPGEMGTAVGRCLAGAGHEVLWAAAGRSHATAARAGEAGLTAVPDVAAVAGRADVVLSVCPPHAALGVAREVSAAGFCGLYVDANAVSPATAREVAGIVEAGGAAFVDGGIIGPPPAAPGDTRLYLSGGRAPEVGRLFEGTALDARLVDRDDGPVGVVGSASAVKMAYAAWTKGTAALVLAARGLARAEGVEDTLLAEWALSQPGLENRSARAAGS